MAALPAGPQKGQKSRFSYIIKNETDTSTSTTTLHRQGINALVLGPPTVDANGSESGFGGVLWSGGRDSLINGWNLKIPSKPTLHHIPNQPSHQHQNQPSASKPVAVKSSFSSLQQDHHGRTSTTKLHSQPPPQAQTAPQPDSAALLMRQGLHYTASIKRLGHRTDHLGSGQLPLSSSLPSLLHASQHHPHSHSATAAHQGPADDHADKNHSKGRVSFGGGHHRPHTSFTPSARTGRSSVEGITGIPYDNIVQYNKSILQPTPPSHIFQTIEGHTDWINDLALLDKGHHLVSCSSDRTVVLWDTVDTNVAPVKLGIHNDYVKKLALPTMRNWVCSGGLDRSLLLWDLNESRPNEPQVLYSDESPFGSIYSLATNPLGSLIISGSAQKQINVFDPRSPTPLILQLHGHSDVIRDLLLSDDGKWALSASSDTTIKLWNLSMPNHCVTTFNHSEAPVWCLASDSPNFETFWAGAKDGWVYKLSRSPHLEDDDGGNVDCIALCKETHPVLKIAGTQDAYVYTATTSSTINRYPDIPFTMNPSNFQIHASSICRRESINEPETESLYSRPVSIRSGMESHFQSEPSLLAPVHTASPDEEMQDDEEVTPVWPAPVHCLLGVAGIRKSMLLNNKRHLLTQDTEDVVCVWDLICCCKIKTLGKIDFAKACETENPVEWVANWCTVQTNLGDITVHLDEGRCYDSEVYFQDLCPHVEPKNEDQRVNLAKWVMTYLLYTYLKSLYPTNQAFDPLLPKPIFNHGGKPKLPASLQIPKDGEAGTSPDTPSLKVTVATPLAALMSETSLSSSLGSSNVLSNSPSAMSGSPSTHNPNLNSTSSLALSTDNLSSGDDAAEKRDKGRSASFIYKLKNFRIRSGSSPRNADENLSTSNLATTQLKSNDKSEMVIFYEECPYVDLDPNITLVFSQEESPAIFNDIFQARVCDLGHDEFQQTLPTLLPWVYDWLIQGISPPKDLAKLSFVLVKHAKSALPEIPQETSRLTANRMLRIRKVIQYLCDKINITPHPACIGSAYSKSIPSETSPSASTPEGPKKVYIELYCQGKLLNFRQTLATIKYCICKTGGTYLVFNYLERKAREA